MLFLQDLELTDSKELPLITAPVQSAVPLNLFGDVIMVTEFFYLFGEHVDLREEFPDGVQIGQSLQSLPCLCTF